MTKYSRKFLAEHEADLELYRAAQAEMRSLLGGAKLPKMDGAEGGRPQADGKEKTALWRIPEGTTGYAGDRHNQGEH